MSEEVFNAGRDLNSTFVPGSLLRKSDNKLATSLTAKYQFQKTTGNSFIHIDPAQIKFAGYDLDKSYTHTFRIINRAPIPQRITIIPPENTAFAIKTNKKGSIAAGMSQIVTVLFRSNQYKYQTDVVSIRTETDNFVVPLYAYPTLPDLRAIFPKLIDFGTVQCKEPATYYYPIKNNVPLNFEFQFVYQKESQQISINPLKGIIPAEQTVTIEITFMPTAKYTSTADVYLQVQQFDFQPLPIRIMGSGKQPGLNPSKRMKSSKLAPIKEGEQTRKTPQPLLKRRPPSGQVSNMSATHSQLAGNTNLINAQTGGGMKKTHIRTNFPRMMSAKRTLVEEQTKPMNPAKIAERDYLNRFSRVHDLDKEKEIKFAQFLGDKAMTETEIDYEKKLTDEFEKARMHALEKRSVERYNPEKSSEGSVEFKIVAEQTVTWDDKKNDEHHARRLALLRFMNAGTKVILKYRLLKRLSKIREFIGSCTTKQEVRKLVEESHAKAMDQQQGLTLVEEMQFDFDVQSLRPAYFKLQHDDNKQKTSNVQFKPEGKTNFDDLTEIKEILPHITDKYKFGQSQYPGDYFNHNSFIPSTRQSGEQQWFLKTAAVQSFENEKLTSVYELPLKVPAHYFIYDDRKIKQYKKYQETDQKDPEIALQNDIPIQDQYEGWTGGQFQLLKYKFSRNLGCQFTTFSGFNHSTENYPLPPMATLGQGLPKLIDEPTYEDTIQDGDSDQEQIQEIPPETGQKFIDQIEGNNADLKDRRSKNQVRNPQKGVIEQIEKSLENVKMSVIGEFIGKVKEANRWVETDENRFLL